MAEDLKISQLPAITNPTGAEMIPVALDGGNGRLTLEQIVEKSQAGMVSEDDWNAERKQFGFELLIQENGTEFATSNWKASDFIPLNTQAPLSVCLFMDSGDHSQIYFYDGGKKFISAIKKPTESKYNYGYVAEYTLEANSSEYPADAAFFRVHSRTYPVDKRVSYSNGSTHESREGATSDAIAKSKVALFDDMWIALGYEAGFHFTSIDRISDPTHPYVCNEVHLTYNEAQEVVVVSTPDINMYRRDSINAKTIIYRSNGYSQNHRTNVPSSKGGFITSCHSILALRVSADTNEMVCNASDVLFWNCRALVNVFGVINISAANAVTYTTLPALVNVKFKGLKANFGLPDSPLLSLESLQYLVTNAANGTTTITVTVHPDVYAKLSDTSNTEWHKVMTDAAAKNISFATNA